MDTINALYDRLDEQHNGETHPDRELLQRELDWYSIRWMVPLRFLQRRQPDLPKPRSIGVPWMELLLIMYIENPESVSMPCAAAYQLVFLLLTLA